MGISATLTADAGQLEGVSVISRERVSEVLKTFPEQTGERGDSLFLRAARELRARWLVAGGFQRSGDAVRVTASITDVASGQLVGSTKVVLSGREGLFIAGGYIRAGHLAALQDQQQRTFTIARARIEPEFDRLRDDARFQRLLETGAG